MSDYTLNELSEWDEKIIEIAQNYKLDWFPIEYETCDYYEMIGSMAYTGLPTYYPHWSFGKAFERTHQMYNSGMEGLPFELIINSNPSIAYLMRDNPLFLQILIMAHCVGHSDFFKNNRMFKYTRPETIIQRMRAAKKRIQGYIEDPSIGIEEVEKVLDACHALQFQSDKEHKVKKSQKELKLEYAELIKNDETGKYENFDLNKIPLEPEYDLLYFIGQQAQMPDWKRDIIEVCRDMGRYFWPQIQTKTINEGWASFIHYNICHDLKLPDSLHIPFLKLHNQVVRPHVGSINPYHLGFHLFQKIKEKHGLDECLIARENCNDASFLRQYLTLEECIELNLFTYSKKYNGDVVVDNVSDIDDWKDVKKELLRSIGGGSIPMIYVEEINHNQSLLLKHEHEGRDLDIDSIKKVLIHAKVLWGKEVELVTKISGSIRKF